MAGRVAGKVAVVTGGARGQGRSHCVRLAQEGADIITVDSCSAVPTVGYDMPTLEDLAETVRQVEATGQRVHAAQADVRDLHALTSAIDEGVDRLGRLDIVSANAGICGMGLAMDLDPDQWRDMLDINLTGVWHTAKATVPHIVAGKRGGSLVITNSALGLIGMRGLSHYSAAKHGLVGLMRTLAAELGEHGIRVNSLHPSNVDTDMLQNDAVYSAWAPELPQPGRDDLAERSRALHMLDVPWVESIDVSNALLFLASDEARYNTAVTLPIDAGATQKI